MVSVNSPRDPRFTRTSSFLLQQRMKKLPGMCRIHPLLIPNENLQVQILVRQFRQQGVLALPGQDSCTGHKAGSTLPVFISNLKGLWPHPALPHPTPAACCCTHEPFSLVHRGQLMHTCPPAVSQLHEFAVHSQVEAVSTLHRWGGLQKYEVP